MGATNDIRESTTMEDIKEYIELMKELTATERAQVKGIMVGMQLTRQQQATA